MRDFSPQVFYCLGPITTDAPQHHELSVSHINACFEENELNLVDIFSKLTRKLLSVFLKFAHLTFLQNFMDHKF